MSRPIVVILVLFLLVPMAQAQLFSTGAPASVVSPSRNGTGGAPASVVSPVQTPPGVHPPVRAVFRSNRPLRRFGNPRERRHVIVPVPLFYPIYTDGYPADPMVSSDQPASSAADDDLQQAYDQGVRDAERKQNEGEKASAQDDRRYGEHYMDSREKEAARERTEERRSERGRHTDEIAQNTPPPAPAADDSPVTVFVFRDGHTVETKNFAIMGQTLFDFSGKLLKKVQLDDLDRTATLKANDDRGVVVLLP